MGKSVKEMMLLRVMIDTNPHKIMWRCEFSMFSLGNKKEVRVLLQSWTKVLRQFTKTNVFEMAVFCI